MIFGQTQGSAPTPAPTLKIPASRGHPLWWPTCLGLEMGVCSMICTEFMQKWLVVYTSHFFVRFYLTAQVFLQGFFAHAIRATDLAGFEFASVDGCDHIFFRYLQEAGSF